MSPGKDMVDTDARRQTYPLYARVHTHARTHAHTKTTKKSELKN